MQGNDNFAEKTLLVEALASLPNVELVEFARSWLKGSLLAIIRKSALPPAHAAYVPAAQLLVEIETLRNSPIARALRKSDAAEFAHLIALLTYLVRTEARER